MSHLKNSNFRVLKCYDIAIDLSEIFQNLGKLIMAFILLVFIILFIIFLIKGNKQISLFLEIVIKNKFINNKDNKKSKNKDREKGKKIELKFKSKFQNNKMFNKYNINFLNI